MDCPHCGTALQQDASFCSGCGNPLTETTVATTVGETTEQTETTGPARCFYHPSVLATSVCSKCGNILCPNCSKQSGGSILCVECYSKSPVNVPATASVNIPAAAPISPQPMQAASSINPQLQNIYDPFFDVSSLDANERESLMQHNLKEMPVAQAVILTIVTVGIFSWIYYGIQHGELPQIKSDDPSAGKAIGFYFIPVFGAYWQFIFWHRLADRINLQFKLRNQVSPIKRDFIKIANILWCIPYVNAISILILFPILVSQVQTACNQLAAAFKNG